jgi:hypothetical protein
MISMRRIVLASVLAIAWPAGAAAQSSRATVVPDFRPLRWDENWSSLPTGALDNAIKHITLAPHDVLWLTLGGAFRWRNENDHNYQFAPAANMQNDFNVSRTLLSADLHLGGPGPYARAFAEFRDAQGYNRTLPGGVRTNEQDRSDWQNAFAEAGWGTAVAARYGRQDITLGKERLVGISDWTNSRRNFQGARVRAEFGGVAIDAVDAHVMLVRMTQSDLPDTATRFRYVALGSATPAAPAVTLRPAVWQAYAMRIDGLVGAALQRITYGVRSEWRVPVVTGAVASAEVETAAQRGTQGALGINAWFMASEAQLSWRGLPFKPMLLVGYDRASGDRSTTDATAGTFTAMYASAHSHGGIADVFGRGNLAEQRVGATADITSWWKVQWISRAFSRVELTDGVYTKQNTLFRAAAGNTSRDVGAEHDVEATFKVGRHLRLQAGYAAVNPGAFLRTTPAGAQPIRFAYGTTTFIF